MFSEDISADAMRQYVNEVLKKENEFFVLCFMEMMQRDTVM